MIGIVIGKTDEELKNDLPNAPTTENVLNRKRTLILI